MHTRRSLSLGAALALAAAAAPALAQQPTSPRPTVASAAKPKPSLVEARRARLIRNALSAAPDAIAEHAAVMAPGADGKLEELRPGTNGWTCMPDDPTSPTNDPACANAPAMRWFQSYMNHDVRPANVDPGIVYMLQGAADMPGNDPWAKPDPKAKWVVSPAHWMLLWPIDSAGSGFPTTPKKTGTWIMWAGTPYAHLMINQKP